MNRPRTEASNVATTDGSFRTMQRIAAHLPEQCLGQLDDSPSIAFPGQPLSVDGSAGGGAQLGAKGRIAAKPFDGSAEIGGFRRVKQKRLFIIQYLANVRRRRR